MDNEGKPPVWSPELPPEFFRFVPPKNGVRVRFEKYTRTEEEDDQILAEPIENEDPEA